MSEKKCPQCGTPLAANALAGLCPACLLKAGVTGETATTTSAFVPPSVATLAEKFPQLEILELIGKGGMGAVYKARQKELDRIVALKILPPGIGDEAAFAERFSREARALAKLNHPGIVTIHDFGRADGLYYFVMEFVDGVNLRQLLQTGRISPREALAIVPQICDALQFAHDQGIVHRDIKPENLLMDRRGRVKVADFGLAKLVESREVSEKESAGPNSSSQLTEAGKIMGTPNYMAPEQFQNPLEVDHRADIYALGVVFYQMLTGELPGQRIEPPSKKVQIDVRLDEIVLRALEKNPERRYEQASELKTEVETIAGNAAPPVTKTKVLPKEDFTFQRSGLLSTGLIVAALSTVFYFAFAVLGMVVFQSLRKGPSWEMLWVVLLLILTPFVVARAHKFVGRSLFSEKDLEREEARMWLKGWAWTAFAFSLPVVGFGVFFLYAMTQDTNGWNPSLREAILVSLTWIGSVLMPLACRILFRSTERKPVSPPGKKTALDYIALAYFLVGTLGTLLWMAFTRWQSAGPLIVGCVALLLALVCGIFRFGRLPGVLAILFAVSLAVGAGVFESLVQPNRRAEMEALREEKVFEQKKEIAARLAQEGWAFFQKGQPDKALRKFEEAVKLDPSDVNLWNGLGWASFHVDFEKAKNCFQNVLSAEPNHPAALNGLGQIALAEWSYDEAENWLLQSAEAHPQASAAWHGLTRLYLIKGNFEEARKWAEKVVASPDADAIAQSMLKAAKEERLSDELRAIIQPPLKVPVANAAIGSELNGYVPLNVADVPPVVVETRPVSGAREVTPGLAEIRVRFSKEMTDGSWSWTTAWENSTPEIIGEPRYENDHQTCVIKVKLEPGRTYAFWLNSQKFQNFSDSFGNPAIPYLLIFQTIKN